MKENKEHMAPDLVDRDDPPDLSTPEWKAIIDARPVRRGRPKANSTKVLTTLRLNTDVSE